MIVRNITKSTIIAVKCSVADNFIKRFKGLMGRKELPEGSGLIITPCNSIHMFFMKIPLDIIFVDKNNTVVHLLENIQPWQVSKIIRKSSSVIELPVGTIKETNTQLGDRLSFE